MRFFTSLDRLLVLHPVPPVADCTGLSGASALQYFVGTYLTVTKIESCTKE